ncbi:hypothetical protein [Nocardioides sp. GXQ0305]|uniref:hypothetical protein n=1 Tax=Nocardioides sp. GXQ0305 TaxID=3423912 RepID=UPI003D7E827C
MPDLHTLQDLRSTLAQHAHDVPDDTSVVRVAAVHGRARRARQQRAGAVVVGAVLAVVGVVLVPSLGERGPQPADAPDTMTSLGWSYRLASTESGDGRVVVELGDSDTPRLVSWATPGGDQRVAVREQGVPSRTSDAADYADFTWVAPGGGRVTVAAASGGEVDVAVYELDSSQAPPGVGEGVLTFREDVAGRSLLGAALGEPGEASLEVPVTPTDETVWLATTCADLPRGTRVHLAWADERGSFSSGACDSGSSFDPGGSAGTGFPPGRHAGQESTLRMWLTRGGRPVVDGELPDVRIGLGAYTPVFPPVDLAAVDAEKRIEHDGREWVLEKATVARRGQVPWLGVPEEGRFVVVDGVEASGVLRYAVTADGQRVGSQTTYLGSGGGGGGPVDVAPGSRVSIRVATPTSRLDAAGLALYRLTG